MQGPPVRTAVEEENILIPRRILATAITILFLATTLAPFVGASTEPTPNGDVIINGAFTDATPRGHALKLYCDANNPTPLAGPEGECAHANEFVAYDWTAPVAVAGEIGLPESGGILVPSVTGADTAFIQQHFNGSDAPDRIMAVYRIAVTGSASDGASSKLRVDLRADVNGDGAVEDYLARVTLLPSSTTTTLSAGDLVSGVVPFPAGQPVKVRSLRIWVEGPADALLTRVSVYATNGPEARNVNILSAGDDTVDEMGALALLAPGDDGKYSFLVGMAADNGEFLPTKDAFVCLYDGSTALADRGFPKNSPIACEEAYLKPDSPAITKTKVGEAFRFDIDASAVVVPSSELPAFALYATVKVDGSYDLETPGASSEFKSGYFHLGRVAADLADVGVSNEFFGPTPILIDANADGKPDYAQTQDTDGYSVIITPKYTTETPLAAVMTTDVDANFVFDVQVYRYAADGTGAPMDMLGGIAFGIFDASSTVNGGVTSTSTDLFRAESRHLSRVDAQTWRVTVPASELAATGPIGAWAFHNVGNPAHTNAFGTSTSSTDFYSGLRNSVKDSAIADGMRSLITPIVLDGASLTRDATFVIRADPDADEITALDGTLVIGDKGDGTITFEYALVIPDGKTVIPNSGHGLAIYDAAGAASDGFAPGSSQMEHAEYTATGVATGDGWFRVDVPLSAFENAKGAVGAWGWTDNVNGDGFLLSRSGWYNVLKPQVASISTTAAETSLYVPTPIVVLDSALGIPLALSSALNGAGTDLVSINNPLVNPGFEADILVEGANDQPDATGATMTSPPWFLRLDDKGTGQPTNPRSTHSVASGKGQLADNALKVSFHGADRGKTLMLGQILGNENGGDAMIWRGASSVSLDIMPIGSADVTLQPYLRYLAADGTVQGRSATKVYTASGEWGHVELPMVVPADAKLLGFYLVMDAPSTTTFYLDNIVLHGAKTAMGDSRSDISDGFAVVISPENLDGAEQSLVETVDGTYYMYTVEVMDYTQGAPRALDVSSIDRAFALRTEALQKGGAETLTLRRRDDAFVALVPAADAPDVAVPWAFVNAGEPYATFDSDFINHPASGHYNPVKNALAAFPHADQLDYAATPITFSDAVATTMIAQQTLELVAAPGGGHQVLVKADSDFVETTTVTLTKPATGLEAAEEVGSYAVTLASADGDIVPGLLLTDEDLNTVTVTSADTRFTRGASLIAGSPHAQFVVCRPIEETCLDTGILTGEVLSFRSTSISPTGEPLTAVWAFGDGSVSTETDDTTTHAYGAPGVKTVSLTVQTPSGKRSTIEKDLTVNNRAPTIAGLDITPTQVFTDSLVRARARAADADGGSLSYAWTVDSIPVPGATSSSLVLSASVLEETTGVPALEKRAYLVGVTVSDGQNGVATMTKTFTVSDRPASLSAPAFSVAQFGGEYALPGDSLDVSVVFEDLDNTPTRVTLDYETPEGAQTIELADAGEGEWTGALDVGATPGDVVAVATAYAADDSVIVASPESTFEVRANAPPVVTIDGPDAADLGAPATYTVTAVDPEGRGIGSIELAGAQVSDLGDGEFEVVFDTIGTTLLTATATDSFGAAGLGTLEVDVDDTISVAMEIVQAPTSATEGWLVLITVTDAYGVGIGGADVTVEDFYSVVPASVDTQEVQTDLDGTVVVRIRPEAVVAGLPLERSIVATASADSLPEAPVQDVETAETTLVLREATGVEGLPLP